MQPRNLLIGLVLGIAIAAGLALALRDSSEQAVPRNATILPAGNTLPDFALLDQDGAPVDKTVFEGQWDVVFFGFTNCPDICPATMTVLGQAKRQLEAEDKSRHDLGREAFIERIWRWREESGGNITRQLRRLARFFAGQGKNGVPVGERRVPRRVQLLQGRVLRPEPGAELVQARL